MSRSIFFPFQTIYICILIVTYFFKLCIPHTYTFERTEKLIFFFVFSNSPSQVCWTTLNVRSRSLRPMFFVLFYCSNDVWQALCRWQLALWWRLKPLVPMFAARSEPKFLLVLLNFSSYWHDSQPNVQEICYLKTKRPRFYFMTESTKKNCNYVDWSRVLE